MEDGNFYNSIFLGVTNLHETFGKRPPISEIWRLAIWTYLDLDGYLAVNVTLPLLYKISKERYFCVAYYSVIDHYANLILNLKKYQWISEIIQVLIYFTKKHFYTVQID